MAVRVNEVRNMSDYEIVLYVRKFTQEYLVDSGWDARAIKELYRRFDMICEKNSSKKKAEKEVDNEV